MNYDNEPSSTVHNRIDDLCDELKLLAAPTLDDVADRVGRAPSGHQTLALKNLLETWFAHPGADGPVWDHIAVAECFAVPEAVVGQAAAVANANANAEEFRLPDQVGDRYRLDLKIGQGGMGVVGRYYDTQLSDTPVAIKFARPRGRLNTQQLLDHEVESLVRTDHHPNLVTLLDYPSLDSAADQRALVMKYVDGATVEESRLALASLSSNDRSRTALKWTCDIASAVGYLHRKGIFHRDIKPSNVLLNDDGHLFVTDFGLAWTKTIGGKDFEIPAGTVAYMSPKIAAAILDRNQLYAPGSEDDVYALGVVLFELLTGTVPYLCNPDVTDARIDRLDRIRRGDWNRQLLRDAGIGSGLTDLVKACLAVDPKARPTDGDALVTQVNSLLEPANKRRSEPPAPAATRAENRRPPKAASDQAWLGTACLQDQMSIEQLTTVFAASAGEEDSESRVAIIRGETGSGRQYLVESALFKFNQLRYQSTRLIVLDLDGFELFADGLGRFLEYQATKRQLPVDGIPQLLADLKNSLVQSTSTAAGVGLALLLNLSGSISSTTKALARILTKHPVLATPVEFLHAVVEYIATVPSVIFLPAETAVTAPDRRVLMDAVESNPGLSLVIAGSAGVPAGEIVTDRPCLSIDIEKLDRDFLERRVIALLGTQRLPSGLIDVLWSHGHGHLGRVGGVLLFLLRDGLLMRGPEGEWSLKRTPDGIQKLKQQFTPHLLEALEELRSVEPRLTEILALAAVCGNFVPIRVVLAALKMPEPQVEAVIDLFDDHLCDSDDLPVFADRGYSHPGFMGTTVYELRSPLIRDLLLNMVPSSRRRDLSVALYTELQQRLPPQTYAIGQLHLEVLGDIPNAARQAYSMRLGMSWWVASIDAERLEEHLTRDLTSRRLDAEVLWTAVSQLTGDQFPLRRLAMLNAWASNPDGIRIDRTGTYHFLRALSLERLGSMEEAEVDARSAVEACGRVRGNNWIARSLLHARLKIRTGQATAALSDLEHVIEVADGIAPRPDREMALAHGLRADILQSRGDVDEALRIRQEEELPVYEKLGDVRSRAVTMGEIADILKYRGDVDEALRIRQEEELPVYEKLGDVRSRAGTMGKIADILQSRGDVDEALRIRQEEELPVYEKLGDVRSLLVGRANLAISLLQQDAVANRDEARKLLLQALEAAEQLRIPEAAQIAKIVSSLDGSE